jgi:hypothetical protein
VLRGGSGGSLEPPQELSTATTTPNAAAANDFLPARFRTMSHCVM